MFFGFIYQHEQNNNQNIYMIILTAYDFVQLKCKFFPTHVVKNDYFRAVKYGEKYLSNHV